MIFPLLLMASVSLAAHIKEPRLVSPETKGSPYDHPEVTSYDVPIYARPEERAVEDQLPNLNEIPHISTSLELPKESPRIPPEPVYYFGQENNSKGKTKTHVEMVKVPMVEFKLDEHMYDVPKVVLALEPDKYRPSYFEDPIESDQDSNLPASAEETYNYGNQPLTNFQRPTSEEQTYNYNSQPQSEEQAYNFNKHSFSTSQQQSRHYAYHFKNSQSKTNRFNFKTTSNVFSDSPFFDNLSTFFNRNKQFPLIQHRIEPLADLNVNSSPEDNDKFVTVVLPKDAKKWRYDWLYKYHV